MAFRVDRVGRGAVAAPLTRLLRRWDREAPVADGKPTQEKFDTYDEYVEALTNWTVEQRVTETVDSRLAAAQDASNRVAAERARAGMLAAHTERVNAARERYADFDAVV